MANDKSMANIFTRCEGSHVQRTEHCLADDRLAWLKLASKGLRKIHRILRVQFVYLQRQNFDGQNFDSRASTEL